MKTIIAVLISAMGLLSACSLLNPLLTSPGSSPILKTTIPTEQESITENPADPMDSTALPSRELMTPEPYPPGTERFPPVDPSGMIATSQNGLILVSPDDGQLLTIHSLSTDPTLWSDREFNWAPDGTRMAFLLAQQSNFGYLMLADFSRGEISPLLLEPNIIGNPVWSPDGEHLAYLQRDEAGSMRGSLIVLDIGDNQTRQLSDSVAWNGDIVWLDEHRIAYLRADLDPNHEGYSTELVWQALDELSAFPLLSGDLTSNSIGAFTLSPDRKQLVFMKGSGLYQVSLDNPASQPRWLALAASVNILQWSPDGQVVLVQAGEGQKWLVEPKAAADMIELKVPGIVGSPYQAWSPDGQSIALLSGPDQPKGIVIYNRSTKAYKILPVDVQFPFELAWNPHPPPED